MVLRPWLSLKVETAGLADGPDVVHVKLQVVPRILS